MLFKFFLYTHITAGTLGLLLGPVAMNSRKIKGLHTNVGNIYHWLVFVVCVSAIQLSVMHWKESSYLFFVALLSYGFAFRGYWAAKKKRPGWLKHHVAGMLGSYIALVTALLVVNRPNIPILNSLPVIVVWLLPTMLGVPAITLMKKKV